MHAPASVVVGMRYSRVVSRVMAGIRYFSSTRSRAEVIRVSFNQRLVYKGMMPYFYHDSSTCVPLMPRLSVNFQSAPGTHYEHFLQGEKKLFQITVLCINLNDVHVHVTTALTTGEFVKELPNCLCHSIFLVQTMVEGVVKTLL